MAIILRPNEQLIKVVRKHYMFVLPAFFTWPWLIVAMLLARYLAKFQFFGYWRPSIMIVSLVVAIIIFYRYFIWRLDALIITNQRVVENDQHSFFSKTVNELLYQDILEISYVKDGMNAAMYNYGDLKVRTAAQSEIVIEKIPNPNEVVDTINQIRQGARQVAGPVI